MYTTQQSRPGNPEAAREAFGGAVTSVAESPTCLRCRASAVRSGLGHPRVRPCLLRSRAPGPARHHGGGRLAAHRSTQHDGGRPGRRPAGIGRRGMPTCSTPSVLACGRTDATLFSPQAQVRRALAGLDLGSHVGDLVRDAIGSALPAQWEARARVFEDRRPRPGDYLGLDPGAAQRIDRRCAASAAQCRLHAAVPAR